MIENDDKDMKNDEKLSNGVMIIILMKVTNVYKHEKMILVLNLEFELEKYKLIRKLDLGSLKVSVSLWWNKFTKK